MGRGVDPAMLDSLGPYCTLGNAALALLLAGSAWLGHRLARRAVVAPRRLAAVAGCCCLAVIAAGAPAHVAHRNAVVAFARALLPRAVPAVAPGERLLADADAAGRAPQPPDLPLGSAAGRSVVMVVLESVASRFLADADGARTMPFLHSLTTQGLVCRQAYAVYPESIEGQVPLFCALPPQPDAEPDAYELHGRAALPHRLRPHGYRSGLFHAGHFRFLGMRAVLAPMGFDVLADATTIGGTESSFGVDEEHTVDALLAWVAAQPAAQPLLACWLPIAGHHPYSSPAGGPFATDHELGCYRNALHYADRSLRRLWEGLCRVRPAEHWLLCVVGDHGQAFGEHPGNHGHSFELYEENLRVPLLFVAPGTALAGRSVEVPCSHLDVVPTLLDLLGIGTGPSLLRPGPTAGRVHAFTDWGELLVAVRVGRWKLIHDVGSGSDRLFDLIADPHERHDVAAAQVATVAPLRAAALQFLADSRRAPGR
jgi:lipoteichoic acid synthase